MFCKMMILAISAWSLITTAVGAPGSEVAEGLTSYRVFTAGKDGYPHYRIPTIVTSRKGTLLAFAEGRYHPTDHGRNDIVLKRSTDNGKTWSPLITIHKDKELVMVNPSPVVLPNNRILLLYETFPFGYHARKGREHGISFQMMDEGYESPRTQKCIMRYSDDDGKTWSAPRFVQEITREPTHSINSGSPANGIVLQRGKHQGRILFPLFHAWMLDQKSGKRTFKNSVLYSDDQGRSWKRSAYVPESIACNENLIVELDNGDVMMNGRSGRSGREIAISKDGGRTWGPYVSDKVLTGRPCNSGLFRFSYGGNGQKSRLLFSNNFSNSKRANGTLRISYDNGQSWAHSKTIVPGLFGYSQITAQKDGNIGVIYEPFQSPSEPWHIDYVPVSLEWLTNGADTLK